MAFEGLFSKKRYNTPARNKNPFKGLFSASSGNAQQDDEQNQQKTPDNRFLAPIGGVQIGENKWRTPSGSIWEYRPDGTRIVKLATQFGGGSFAVNPNNPNELVKSDRDYAGVPSLTGEQRDHIIPVSLGGLSDTRTNIRRVPEDQNPAEFETDIANKLKSGEITLNQARLAVMT